jgi:hypothetical protein
MSVTDEYPLVLAASTLMYNFTKLKRMLQLGK